ncbi:hypothetical protein [Leptospira stimsonii]|uniref:Uncharacterized protein n=1 Tax=Leptospira stimsonii TaxID=2202203 RepID=A0A8B3CNZ2_9LEPT|nr:hypothetical protein [Leptospira stimsonii]RHX83856.1 hypothetical protein DLM78_20445 [Leptospira stimsonii]
MIYDKDKPIRGLIAKVLSEECLNLRKFETLYQPADSAIEVTLRLQLPEGSTKEDLSKLLKWIEIENHYRSTR